MYVKCSLNKHLKRSSSHLKEQHDVFMFIRAKDHDTFTEQRVNNNDNNNNNNTQ